MNEPITSETGKLAGREAKMINPLRLVSGDSFYEQASYSTSFHRRRLRHRALIQLAAVACLLAFLKPAASFPSGAPESACKDLKPGHGVEAQTGASPFELTQDKLQVEQAGDQIKGKVEGKMGRL